MTTGSSSINVLIRKETLMTDIPSSPLPPDYYLKATAKWALELAASNSWRHGFGSNHNGQLWETSVVLWADGLINVCVLTHPWNYRPWEQTVKQIHFLIGASCHVKCIHIVWPWIQIIVDHIWQKSWISDESFSGSRMLKVYLCKYAFCWKQELWNQKQRLTMTQGKGQC